MRILLLLCLAVVQSSAIATPTPPQEKYDAVLNICGPQHSADQVPANIERDNGFSPLQAISSYFESRGILLNLLTGKGTPESVQMKVLKGPAHGTLVRSDNTSYMYYAKEGYLGVDKVILEVEILGKMFKVIQTLVIHNSGNLDYPTEAAQEAFRKACPSDKGSFLNIIKLPTRSLT